MKIFFSKTIESSKKICILPFWEGPEPASSIEWDLSLSESGFLGKNGEVAFCIENGQKWLLLGLGKQTEASVEALRKAYASATRFIREKKMKEMAVIFPKCKQKNEFIIGISEGILLSNYAFSYKEKKDQTPLIEKLTFIGSEKFDLTQIETIISGVNFVRDLVNSNADDKIDRVVNCAKKLHAKVKCKIFEKKDLEKGKFGLILAVSRGSNLDPKLVELTYRGNPKSKERIVLVGKGITYDSGGLSLKPTDNMVTMKCDMAGSATVLGAIKTAAHLALKVNVTALLPLAENSIDGKSYKLGDVYTSYSGQTVEINNTDAEGRLVLADALSYAVKHLKPTCMIDLATLTGACVVALGEEFSGLFSNNEDLAEDLLLSSDRTDELIWQMPMYQGYKEFLKSDIADMVNSPGREAGSIKAALFLEKFVGEIPWAHLDIAGPAYVGKPKHYNPHKGTGHGLRLLVDFLMRRSS